MNLDHLSAEEWKALDDELDRLLDLDASDRAKALASIESCAPERARLLRTLLESERTQQRIDQSLLAALSFLAECEPQARNTRIGAWRLLRRIGQGGMAEVYLAERADGAFEQTVALKLLWPGLTGDTSDRLVRQERQILAAMDDVRIARLVDGGVSDDGRPWLAIEYVQGEPITAFSDRQHLDLADRVRLLLPVARAVALAHRQLVVHGDLKPAHVLVNEQGKIKLLDFGIGQLLDHQTGRQQDDPRWHALTPDYASPEQQEGAPPTPASDIYQLGLLLRRLTDDHRLLHRQNGRELQAIIDHACQTDARQRYAGADRLADDLEAWLLHRPIAAYKTTATYRLTCLLQRQWPVLSVTGLAIGLIVAALIHQSHQARELARGNATNEAVMTYLEQLLVNANPYLVEPDQRLSRHVLLDAATRLDSDLEAQPEARARLLNVLGEMHRTRSELVLAQARFESALGLAETHGLIEAADQARTGLATISVWTGDYARSEGMLQDMVADRTHRFGPNHPDVLSARLNLADLLHSRGDYAQAGLQIDAVLDQDHHQQWAHRLQGMLQRDRGQFDFADRILRTTIESERQAHQGRDAWHSSTLDNHALTLLHLGQHEEALGRLDQSDVVRGNLLGSDWEGLVWTRHWRGLTALSLGQLDEALALLNRMVRDYEQFFTESSHLLAFARSDRGWVRLAQGDAIAALTDFDLAIARLEAIQRVDHPRLSEMLMGRSLALLATGQAPEALRAAQRAYAIRRQLLAADPGHDWLRNSCQLLRWAGGQCPITTAERRHPQGLDHLRLVHALHGLCPRSIASRTDDGPCG